jgi:prolyl-tRNA synthetase
MTLAKEKSAISPTREENFPEWYQQVVKAADLGENSVVRGCMVIKPWGFGIWENMQKELDSRIKETGHENAYFPLFVPLSFLEKEAKHVEGFAKECAVVTHHRLEQKDGKLVPSGPLEEPLIVRPTSEMIIGESFSRWVESYRDLPLLINQWANVVRWEMRPRIFLRTTEFLWQEGHTVHATHADAMEEALLMHEVYRDFIENTLAIPVIIGKKSPGERFPGADETYTLEAMMQDRKALQMGTSHYLGQNFAKGSNIRFCNQQGELEYAYTTSWGMTTRLIGALVMVHSDNDGLVLPPKVAHKQIVIIPVVPKAELEEDILNYAEAIAKQLRAVTYEGKPLSVIIDKRNKRGGEKNWDWIKKGIPLRIEVGPRDLESNSAVIYRRDRPHKEKQQLPTAALAEALPQLLSEIQTGLFAKAKVYRDNNIATDLKTFEEFKAFFASQNDDHSDMHGGFVQAKWCGDVETEKLLDDLKVSIRCIPLQQSNTTGTCILTGKPATLDAIFAKSY